MLNNRPILIKFFMILLVLVFHFLAAAGAEAASVKRKTSQTVSQLKYSTSVAEGVNTAAGTAVSPLLVLFCHGLYYNLTSEPEADDLPWHAEPVFLTVLGLILLAIFIKDVAPTGPLKKPLDAVDEAIMPGSALLALLAILPFLMEVFTPAGQEIVHSVQQWLSTSSAYAAEAQKTEPQPLVSAVAGALGTVAGVTIFGVVWLVSNTINVLCLLAPGLAGVALKAVRITVVGGIFGLAAIHPLLGLAASLLLLIVSLIVVRWSFRMTVWGLLFAFDLIARRWRKKPGKIMAFGGSAAPEVLKIPKRTIGYLELEDGRLYFRHRPFLLLSRRTELPPSGELTIGRCLTAPVLVQSCAEARPRPLLGFRLAHRGRETLLAEMLSIAEVEQFGLLKSLSGLQWIKGLWRSKGLNECEV